MPKNKKFTVSYEVFKLDVVLREAERLIVNFNKLNNIPLNNLLIRFDFDTKYYGYYSYETKRNKCIIYVNPKNCYRRSETTISNRTNRHPEDLSVVNVIIHEYCHFIEDKYGLKQEYDKMDFIVPNLYVNSNSTLKGEELVELMTMYICNPYLLKIIGPERFKWLKNKFKSPSPCSNKSFFNIYSTWDDLQKKYVIDKFNLSIIESKEKITKMNESTRNKIIKK